MSTELVVKKTYTASAERVYDAFLDPAKAGKFLFCTPTGTMVKLEIDARVGGKFNFTDRRDEEDVEHLGEYHELIRPTRIVFSFLVQFKGQPSPSTKVEVDIVPQGSGCELTLTHHGVPPQVRERSQGGWTKILEKLAIVAEA